MVSHSYYTVSNLIIVDTIRFSCMIKIGKKNQLLISFHVMFKVMNYDLVLYTYIYIYIYDTPT